MEYGINPTQKQTEEQHLPAQMAVWKCTTHRADIDKDIGAAIDYYVQISDRKKLGIAAKTMTNERYQRYPNDVTMTYHTQGGSRKRGEWDKILHGGKVDNERIPPPDLLHQSILSPDGEQITKHRICKLSVLRALYHAARLTVKEGRVWIDDEVVGTIIPNRDGTDFIALNARKIPQNFVVKEWTPDGLTDKFVR